MALSIEQYSDKSFVVRGDSRAYKDILMNNYGKFNPNLGGSPGYIFSLKHLEGITDIVNDINSGKINPSNQVKVYAKKNETVAMISTVPTVPTASTAPSKNQTLIYNVHKPTAGETVIVDYGNEKVGMTVEYVNNTSDIVHLRSNSNLIASNSLEAGVYSGKWQIKSEIRQHTIFFS